MLLAIEGHGSSHIDMIASDFRYHRNCMTSYLLRKPCSAEETSHQKCQKAFDDLITDIDTQLFQNERVYYLKTVVEHYQELLKGQGLESVSCKGGHLKTKILEHYKNSDGTCRVLTFSQHGTATLICSSQLCASCLFTETEN